MDSRAGLWAFDWDAELTETDRNRIVDDILTKVDRWKMRLPAYLLISGIAPLGNIAAHGFIAASPLAALLLGGGIGDVQKISRFLSQPANLRALCDRLAEEEPVVTR